ncbi:GtrA family protein [Nostocoides vanveenii]|uniref:GtrA family protein n=1 Tax=Nostocoides vanveenii TaxID=330835 RepID=UPI0031D62F39
MSTPTTRAPRSSPARPSDGSVGGVMTARAPKWVGHVLRFAVVGVASTVAHLGLFALLRESGLLGAQAANLAALLLATLLNTALNRWWTFGVRGGGHLRNHLQGMALLGLNLALTSAGLWLLHTVIGTHATGAETVTIAAANAVATILRFVAMRRWMYGRSA